jgi:hypothetical protein
MDFKNTYPSIIATTDVLSALCTGLFYISKKKLINFNHDPAFMYRLNRAIDIIDGRVDDTLEPYGNTWQTLSHRISSSRLPQNYKQAARAV